jgi:hypothetical protein
MKINLYTAWSKERVRLVDELYDVVVDVGNRLGWTLFFTAGSKGEARTLIERSEFVRQLTAGGGSTVSVWNGHEGVRGGTMMVSHGYSGIPCSTLSVSQFGDANELKLMRQSLMVMTKLQGCYFGRVVDGKNLLAGGSVSHVVGHVFYCMGAPLSGVQGYKAMPHGRGYLYDCGDEMAGDVTGSLRKLIAECSAVVSREIEGRLTNNEMA